MDENYQNLANAIIIGASRDYMRVYKKYLRTGLDYDKVMKEEKFFFSEWFGILTDANPTYLVEGMRKKCEKQVEEEEIDEEEVDGEEEIDEEEEGEDEMTIDNTEGHSDGEEDEDYDS